MVCVASFAYFLPTLMFTGLKSVIFGMRDDGLLGDVLAPAMVLVRAMQETPV